MTFNIRGMGRDDGENQWRFRSDLNVETIQKYNPDLIGFQEVEAGNLDTYMVRLRDYEFVLGPRTGSHTGYCYSPISWQYNRLVSILNGGFWLSEDPTKPAFSWGTACYRSMAWTRFRIAENGTEFIHVNTHLDHVSEKARVEGMRLILKQLAEQQSPDDTILVTGDFNCTPSSEVYGFMREQGFTDTFLAAGNKDDETANTFHGFGRSTTVERIDWIMLRDPSKKFQVRSSEIIRDARPPLYPSDHYPVMTVFEV
jgi:endonuclease/exonuclease/phosphatase family metal-dependent hydrolase